VAKSASFRRRTTAIIATIGTIVIIGTIATIGIIAGGNVRASGRTIDAKMHRAGSTGLPAQPAQFVFKNSSHSQEYFCALPGACPSGAGL
jgi:hypothetical protein